VVQDYFMTDTAQHANLVLPSSMPFEIGGSFTNTQKMIQEFEPVLKSKAEKSSYAQLGALLKKFGLKTKESPKDIMMEAIKLLPTEDNKGKLQFHYTSDRNCKRTFNYGCDVVVKHFEEQFENSLKK
ncbi:MAG: molybdopterin-dependent oxidoreductase, partial [Bacteroidales bacterium]|nr:molybdopterin-dependent oxidoreductase [Bacteroidales bacterium]